MRSALFASAFVAVTWLAFGSVTAHAQGQADAKAASCQTCGKTADCPHCSAGESCPHCTDGKDCPHCKGDKACPHCAKGDKTCPHSAKGAACAHCGKGHPRHGKWGSHNWEYKCVRPAKKPDAMTKQFSGLGERGWRLVEADGGIWCFSRMVKSQ